MKKMFGNCRQNNNTIWPVRWTHVSLSGEFQPFFIQVNTRPAHSAKRYIQIYNLRIISSFNPTPHAAHCQFDRINPSRSTSKERGQVVTGVMLSQGSTCLVGQVVTRVKLSQGLSCLMGQVFCGSSCHKGRVVMRVELSMSSSCPWPVCIKSSKYYLLENVSIYFNGCIKCSRSFY